MRKIFFSIDSEDLKRKLCTDGFHDDVISNSIRSQKNAKSTPDESIFLLKLHIAFRTQRGFTLFRNLNFKKFASKQPQTKLS